MRGISWLVEELARSEEGLCDVALFPLSADLLQTMIVHKCTHITWPHALSTILYRYFRWIVALQSDTITHHYSISLPVQSDTRYRPGVAQRVGRGIALLFHDRDTRRGWVVSSKPRPHFTPGKDPVPILQEAGWAPGSVWAGGKSHPHRD